MIATISKDFTFAAAHQLFGLAEGHQCGRMHGHNYVVRLTVIGEVNGVGMVLDYGDMKPFGQWIDSCLDHRTLNDVMQVNPTAELLADYLLTKAEQVLDIPERVTELGVAVSESPKTWATVSKKYS